MVYKNQAPVTEIAQGVVTLTKDDITTIAIDIVAKAFQLSQEKRTRSANNAAIAAARRYASLKGSLGLWSVKDDLASPVNTESDLDALTGK
jgi:hypothetical protein